MAHKRPGRRAKQIRLERLNERQNRSQSRRKATEDHMTRWVKGEEDHKDEPD